MSSASLSLIYPAVEALIRRSVLFNHWLATRLNCN